MSTALIEISRIVVGWITCMMVGLVVGLGIGGQNIGPTMIINSCKFVY
jgi:hypothetical protein